jgi:hypothetical protein
MSYLDAINFFKVPVKVTPDSYQIGNKNKIVMLARSILVGGIVFRASLQAFRVNLIDSFTFTTLASYAPLLAGIAWYQIESRRVSQALNQLAVDKFYKETTISFPISQYLLNHPEAVSDIARKNPLILNKLDCYNKTLLQTIIRNQALSYTERERYYRVAHILINNNCLQTTDILQLFENHPELANYALRIGVIKPDYLSAQEQVKLWKIVQDDQTARLLINNGFSLDVKHQGMTPLMSLVAKEDEVHYRAPQLIFLLRNGAKIPDPEETLSIKTSQETQIAEKTFGTILKERPLIDEIFKQYSAQKREKEVVFGEYRTSFFAFWKPCMTIKHHSWSVDETTLFARTMVIVLPILTIALGLAMQTASFLPLLFLAVPVIYSKMAHSSAVKALGSYALKQFRNYSFPSSDAFEHILNDEALVDLILSKEPEKVTQLNERGNTLLDVLLKRPSNQQNFSVFKKLANRFFDQAIPFEKKHPYFSKLLAEGKLEYIQYLLEDQKIKASSFSAKQQFQCWVLLDKFKEKATEAARLFRRYEFDIEIRDEQGRTPLLAVVGSLFEPKYFHVKALLDAGAYRGATYSVHTKEGEKVRTVKECANRHAAIRPLFA